MSTVFSQQQSHNIALIFHVIQIRTVAVAALNRKVDRFPLSHSVQGTETEQANKQALPVPVKISRNWLSKQKFKYLIS